MPAFEDTNFSLFAQTDNTKFMRFDLSLMTIGTDNIVRMPALGVPLATLALLENTNIWLDLQTFSGGGIAITDGEAVLLYEGTNTYGVSLDAPTLTGNHSAHFPDATGTVALLEAAQDWTGVQTFTDAAAVNYPVTISLTDTALGNLNILSVYDSTSTNRFILAMKQSFNDGRVQTFQDANGTIALVETSSTIAAAINATGQTANITSTDTGVATGKFYRVSYTLAATTADVTAGAVSASFAYTDESGSTTTTSATVPLTTLGNRATGSFVTFLNSGTLNYSTSHTGIFGTAQYSLRIRVESLG